MCVYTPRSESARITPTAESDMTEASGKPDPPTATWDLSDGSTSRCKYVHHVFQIVGLFPAESL